MRTLRKPLLAGALAAAAFGVVQSAPAGDQPAREYVVVYESDASGAAARDAVEDAGGTIVSENSKVGVATVRSSESDFVRQAGAEQALVGAAADKPIGKGDPGPKKEIPGAADEGRRGASQKAPH
jgi:lantibiotic leader peptide-processing serine protease